MKKILGINFGGLQKKTIALVLLMLLLASMAFAAISIYQNTMLIKVVEQTRVDQQQAISSVSRETMHTVLENSVVSSMELRAGLADNDFAEIVSYARVLQAMAQQIFENRDKLTPRMPGPPDPALDGTVSVMALCEEGMDYTQSELLGYAALLGDTLVAIQENSPKIDACYMGLSDGTHLGVDRTTLDKIDENGNPVPFSARHRPWYFGAERARGLYFTGVMRDAFDGALMVTCAIPVIVDDQVLGVIGIDIVLDTMDDFISTGSGNGNFSYVINEKGDVVLGPEDDALFDSDPDHPASIHDLRNSNLSRYTNAALKKTLDLVTVTIDGKEYYVSGAPLPTVGWALLTFIDKEQTEIPEKSMLAEYDRINEDATAEFHKGTDQARATVFLSLIALLLIGLAAALASASKIVKPIEKMTRNIVRSSETGELFQMDDDYRTDDEIQVLAEAFDDLSKKTKAYIGQITAITAEKERIGTELALANRIQSDMLPSIFPAFPERNEFYIFASMDPAKEVGGDFYDYFLVDDDHLCMVMADVSGKGVPAALFMMASKIVLANNAKMGKSPAQIIHDTNVSICKNNREEMFVTVWLGILEISTGKLTAVNAGHEYPILKSSGDGLFELLKDKHGFVVGGFEGSKYKEYELQLQPGAKLFLYTDGVPEATDADNVLFGTDRMIEALNEAHTASPDRILKHVRENVDAFVKDAEQFDDLTMLCFEYRGPQKA